MLLALVVLGSLCALANAGRSSLVKQHRRAVSRRSSGEKNVAIEKRVSWFIEGNAKGTEALLANWSGIVDGAYICCGGEQWNANGTLVLPETNDTAMQPLLSRGIPVMPTFGGAFLPEKAWENRQALADQILDYVLKNNYSGVHNDWENHGDDGVDAYKFYDFWGVVAEKLHQHGKAVGSCIETAPSNVSHPWTPRTLNNDTTWHSYMFNWDYILSLDYMDFFTNMATYPMMHTTDGDNSWCANFPNTTWCERGVEDFVDHLTPAYKYLEQDECDSNRHTVAKWCGMKGQVQDMIDAGVDAASGQLSPGIWMNNCVISSEFPEGITAQGWTKSSWAAFLSFLDEKGVRSIDLWTSLLSENDMSTCSWFLPELQKWREA